LSLFQISPLSSASTTTLNIVLSFVPFPFSLSYLLNGFILGFSSIPKLVILGSVTGSFIYVFLIYIVVRKALRNLRNISSPDIKRFDPKRKKTVVEDISIKTSTPTRAFMKRDISIITRETQQIMMLIMPIMMPIYVAILGFTGAFTEIMGNTGLTDLSIVLMGYVVMNTYILCVSLTNIETGGETITASLPIDPRQQFNAKLPYFFSTIIVAALISVLFLIGSPIFYPTLFMVLALVPSFPLIGIAALLFKIRLFGKLKNKYALEEINQEYKILKHIVGFLFLASIMALLLYMSYIAYWAIFTVEAILLVLVLFVYNYMLPKQNWKIKYIL